MVYYKNPETGEFYYREPTQEELNDYEKQRELQKRAEEEKKEDFWDTTKRYSVNTGKLILRGLSIAQYFILY